MESLADNAWAFAVVGGTILLGLALWFGVGRTTGKRPPEAKAATQPRNYDQPEGEREAPKAGPNP